MSSPRRVPRYFAVMPAGGSGSRLGASIPKQYLELDGMPMIRRAALAMLAAPWIDRLVVVGAAGDEQAANALAGLPRTSAVPEGGETRRASVLGGLRALRREIGVADDDWVLVHDAARPGLDPAALERLRADLADDAVGGLLAMPVSDTVKRATSAMASNASVAETVPRAGLWLAQTPQMFRFGLLLDALTRFDDVTDEASAIERAGLSPRLVPGTLSNFKVTSAEDLATMRRLFESSATGRSAQ